ncbi:MAG TPA: hypothetical protein VNW46_12985 [Gemmatimonadaceae bacterium]|nr:hypothetical protein [Gemmatimonadaceae bacterium]
MRGLPTRLVPFIACTLGAAALACGTTAPVQRTTVAATPALTGYVLAYSATNGAFRTWFGNADPIVGDNDVNVFGETMRGVIAFALPPLPAGTTLRGATLDIAQCQVSGAPFATLGVIVADHLVPTLAPDSATYDTTAIALAVATVATDSTPAPAQVLLTPSVAADYAAGNTTSMFRLRFSQRDGNGDQVADQVEFCPPTLVLTSSP